MANFIQKLRNAYRSTVLMVSISKISSRKAVVGFGTAFGSYIVWNLHRAQENRVKPIDTMLEKGSRPPLPDLKYVVDRTYLVESIKDRFIRPAKEHRSFGIIIGPTGTGKTYTTSRVCNEYPSGVLYLDAVPTRFPKQLAKTVGVPIEPRFFDNIMKYFGSENLHYFKLADDKPDAVEMILCILAERAVFFKKKHGRVPCLFIDGADVIAKFEHDVFKKLVQLAKLYGNSGTLTIVFVSSEGQVMPLFQQTSSYSRSNNVMEILGIPNKEAVKLLMNHGMTESLSKQVVEYVGGTLIHLVNALDVYYDCRKSNEAEQLVQIKRLFTARYVNPAFRGLLSTNLIVAEEVLNELIVHGSVNICDLRARHQESLKARNDIVEVVEKLVKCNMLRYDVDGNAKWHSPLIRSHISDVKKMLPNH